MPIKTVEAQLSFPFLYSAGKHELDEKLSAFLSWGPEYSECMGQNYVYHTPADDDNDELVHGIRLAQRQRSYSNAFRSTDLFGPIEEHMRAHGYVDPTKFERLAPSDGSIPMPVEMEFRYDVTTGRIGFDLALVYYEAATKSKLKRGKDKPFLRMWIHTEYELTDDNFHNIDVEESWFAMTHDTLLPTFHKEYYADVRDIRTNINLIVPWYCVAVNIFSNSLPTYVTNWLGELGSLLAGTLSLNCLSPYYAAELIRRSVPEWGGDHIYHAWYISGISFDQFTNTDSEQNVLLAALVARSKAEVFETIVAGNGDLKVYGAADNKMFWKHFSQTCLALLDTYDGEDLGSWDFNKQVQALMRAYVEFAEIINMYGDPNFIGAVQPIDVVHNVMVNRELGERGRFYNPKISFVSTAKQLMDNEWFASFNKPKQWRFIIEWILYANQAQALEIVTMLRESLKKDRDMVMAIPKRQCKTVEQLHDEVVKAYNVIKFKPLPINEGLVKWLTEYGLEIPDTQLKFVIPTDSNQIREWGKKQAHCLGNYADQMAQEKCLILGVWDGEHNAWAGHLQMAIVPDDPKAVAANKYGHEKLEGTGIAIDQFYAAQNRPVIEPYRQIALTHLARAVTAWYEKTRNPEEKDSEHHGS